MEDDLILVKMAQKGDERAFEKLYQKHIKMIHGFVFNKINNKEEAEDLTSSIWFFVLRDLEKFAFVSSFKNWLFGITKHKILDYLQEKYKLRKVPLIEEIFVANKEEEIDYSDNKDRKINDKLSVILAKLSEKYRKILTLRFLKGYNTLEIAEETGLSVSNVKVIQHRALQKAREINI